MPTTHCQTPLQCYFPLNVLLGTSPPDCPHSPCYLLNPDPKSRPTVIGLPLPNMLRRTMQSRNQDQPMCHLTETAHPSQDPSHLSCLPTENIQSQPSRSPFSFPHLHQVIDGDPVYEVQPLLIIRCQGHEVLYLMDWQGYGPNEHSWVPRRHILDPLLNMDFSRLYRTKLCKHQVEPVEEGGAHFWSAFPYTRFIAC